MWSGVAMPNVTSCGSSTCARTFARSIVCRPGSALVRVVGVLAHPARRVVPGVVGQREARACRSAAAARASPNRCSRRCSSTVPGLMWTSQSMSMPSASSGRSRFGKRAFPLGVMKKFDRPQRSGLADVAQRHRARPERAVASGGGPSRSGIAARSAGLVANQGAKRIVRPGAACARASLQASASVSCTRRSRGPLRVSAAARRGRGRAEEGGVGAGAGGHAAALLEAARAPRGAACIGPPPRSS